MTTLITAAQMQIFAPRCDYVAIAPRLNRACLEFGIDTPREVRHFMAQTHHESAGFTRWVENMNWSTPERLDAFFSSINGTADAAALIKRGPQAIANRVYANKLGNGNEASGDGWRYRGRSPIQCTGEDNYRRAGQGIGLDLVGSPDLAGGFEHGARVAAWWWKANGLNEIVAADPDEKPVAVAASLEAHLRANEWDDLRQARRRVNGPAMAGLDDCGRLLIRAGNIWRG